jgi:hypothetical protein
MADSANKFKEADLPHSPAGHNPYWCGGDCDGTCCGDDPCWSCIGFLHDKALGFLSGVESVRAENERLKEALRTIAEHGMHSGVIPCPQDFSFYLQPIRKLAEASLSPQGRKRNQGLNFYLERGKHEN